MSISAMNWAYQQEITGPAKPVLVVLADHADQDGWCWPSVQRLSFRSGFIARTVQRALRLLEAAGRIIVERCRGRGHVNRYRVLFSEPAAERAPAPRPNGADPQAEKVTEGQQLAVIHSDAKGAPQSSMEAGKVHHSHPTGDTQSPKPFLNPQESEPPRWRRARAKRGASPAPDYASRYGYHELGKLVGPLPDWDEVDWGAMVAEQQAEKAERRVREEAMWRDMHR